jgi:hypothetical protein
MTDTTHTLTKAVLLSPLVALVAAPPFATWLLYQYTSVLPLSVAALPVIAKMSGVWGVGAAIAALIVVASYGLLVRHVLLRQKMANLPCFVIAGALPGALLLLTNLPWQESVVPAVYFGALVFAAFWYFSVKRPGMGANHSFKPTPLRGAA